MATPPTASSSDGASNDGSDGFSTQVFIAVICSVGAVIFLLALLMICSFVILCYREYHKRNGSSRKASDKVGLLRTNGGDEDIVSDQFEDDCKMPPMDSMELKVSESKPPLMATLTSGSRVAPEAQGSGASGSCVAAQQKGSKKSKKGKGSKRASGKRGVASGDGAEEEVVVTMIGGSEDEGEGGESVTTMGDHAAYMINAGVDNHGDETQLIPPKRESACKRKTVDIETKARILGRPVSYVEKLSKSSPHDTEGINELTLSKSGTGISNPLAREYQGVPSNAVELPEQSAAEKAKNRYRNVLPNTHSAVNLKSTGVDGSTYINANFIQGLHGEEKAFIASQGPIFETMSDFWRMVWEHDVNIIVMLTNLIENGRHKCVKYWPPTSGDDKVTHGNMEVTSIHEEMSPSYTQSNLILKNLETDETRTVYHFWYIAWPDFGIPSTAEHILKLRGAVEACRAKSRAPAPVVVHCSAGLGRSGTFIAIDMGIKQYEENGVVDPLKYLCEMRQDRGGMIQTSDQYLFVHKALAEYMNN